MLFAIDLHEDFIDEKFITTALMLSLEASGIPAVTEIESVVEPDSVAGDRWRGSVALVGVYLPILAISAH